MSRIQKTLKALEINHKKGLVPFITAGFPTVDSTVSLMHAMVQGGANIIELGMPFSDPMADGPVLQHASEVALSGGMTLQGVLDAVAQFRRTDDLTPIVLMGYANPIEHMGYVKFIQKAHETGVDGVLVVDYTPEESIEFASQLKQNDMDQIFLIAPTTTDERIKKIASIASGYVYYVSLKGVTGSANLNVQEVSKRIEKIRQYVTIPIGVGFGIRDAATAKALSESSDAVIIGSKIVKEIEQAGEKNAPEAVKKFLSNIRLALDE